MKTKAIRISGYSVLAVAAIAASVASYVWKIINPPLQTLYARSASHISTMLNEYVECNQGVFPTSATQLCAQGFLRVVKGADGPVFQIRFFREYNDWKACDHFNDFYIRYGTSLNEMNLQGKLLISKETRQELDLVAPPVMNGHTKIRTAKQLCQSASVDLASRMNHYAHVNPPYNNIQYAKVPIRPDNPIVSANFKSDRNILIEIKAGYAAGFTPLHYAATVGNDPLAAELIRQGADVNATDSGGFTPLHAAVINSHVNIAQLLLKHGANLEARTNFGTTALHEAVYNDDAVMVQWLIDNGADTAARGLADHTPFSAAERKEYTDIVKLFNNQ